MTQFERLCRAIGTILLADWDPIGIGDVAEAHDEYEPYVVPLANLLLARAPVSELSKYLLETEIGALGLHGNPRRAREAAEKLHAIRILG
jgi:hypothetical protein